MCTDALISGAPAGWFSRPPSVGSAPAVRPIELVEGGAVASSTPRHQCKLATGGGARPGGGRFTPRSGKLFILVHGAEAAIVVSRCRGKVWSLEITVFCWAAPEAWPSRRPSSSSSPVRRAPPRRRLWLGARREGVDVRRNMDRRSSGAGWRRWLDLLRHERGAQVPARQASQGAGWNWTADLEGLHVQSADGRRLNRAVQGAGRPTGHHPG